MVFAVIMMINMIMMVTRIFSVNGSCFDRDDQNYDQNDDGDYEPKAKDTTAKMTMTTTFVPSTSILPDFKIQNSIFRDLGPALNFR